jgi:hypothetical protein
MERRGDNHVSSVTGNPRLRGYLEDGLRSAFPPCYEPLPAEMKQLLQRLCDQTDLRANPSSQLPGFDGA